jgi:hypothetical protein
LYMYWPITGSTTAGYSILHYSSWPGIQTGIDSRLYKPNVEW